jgi:pentatricopeptide repeat protein
VQATTHPTLNNVDAVRVLALPNEIKSFLEELESSKTCKDNPQIRSFQLKDLVMKFSNDPDSCRLLIQESLKFEQEHPNCRGLVVDGDTFLQVIEICVRRGQLQNANQLLTFTRLNVPHFQPHSKSFGVIMSGYAKLKTPQSITKIENMIVTLEDERLSLQASKRAGHPLTCYKYNILLKAYVRVFGKTSVTPVQRTIKRMEDIAQRLEDDSLRPDLACYTTLMHALLLRREPGFAKQVNDVLDKMQSDSQYGELFEKQRMYVETLAIDAWSKSGDAQAPIRARRIFDAMQTPSPAAYDAMCSTYVAVGNVDKAVCLYQKIQSDCDAGKCKDYAKTMNLYNAKQNAIQKTIRSNATRLLQQSDTIEKAELAFRAMILPDTFAFNILLNAYAQQGNVEKSLDLLRRMISDFDTAKNTDCRPNMHTYNTVLNAIHKSNRPDAAEKAEQLVESIPSPDTTTYTTLINIYAQIGDIRKALDLFDRMQSGVDTFKNEVCRPNMHTYATILNALQNSTLSDAVEKAEQIFSTISSPSTYTYNTLINMYAQQGNVEKSLSLLQQMQSAFESGTNQECGPNLCTYNIVLNALDKSNRSDAGEQAEAVFNTISSPDTVAYTTLLNISARKGDIEKALDLLSKMHLDFDSGENKHCRPNFFTYNTILVALQNSNRPDAIEKAETIFKAVTSPNTVMYSTLLNMYAQRGDFEKAVSFLHDMQSDFKSGKNVNCQPNLQTYNTVLNALQKSKRSDVTKKAEQIFNAVPVPDTFTYNTLINVYAQRGNINKALDLLQRMQSAFDSETNKSCCPNVLTYATVLKALEKSDRSDVVEKAEAIFKAVPSPNAVMYTTLLSLYAKLGRIKDVVSLARRMQAEYDSGTNLDCMPDIATRRVLVKAFRNADDSAFEKEGHDVLEWFREQPTELFPLLEKAS